MKLCLARKPSNGKLNSNFDKKPAQFIDAGFFIMQKQKVFDNYQCFLKEVFFLVKWKVDYGDSELSLSEANSTSSKKCDRQQ